jgi:hypothetical protein
MTKLPRDKKQSPPKILENPAELDFYRKLLNGKLSGIERWVLQASAQSRKHISGSPPLNAEERERPRSAGATQARRLGGRRRPATARKL